MEVYRASDATQVTNWLQSQQVELSTWLLSKFQTVSIVSRVLRNLGAKWRKSESALPTKLISWRLSEKSVTISHIGALESCLWRSIAASCLVSVKIFLVFRRNFHTLLRRLFLQVRLLRKFVYYP